MTYYLKFFVWFCIMMLFHSCTKDDVIKPEVNDVGINNEPKITGVVDCNGNAGGDSVISNWMNNLRDNKFPKKITISGQLRDKLRYGENPHQQASVYKINYTGTVRIFSGKFNRTKNKR